MHLYANFFTCPSMLSFTRTVTHRIKRFNRNSHSNTHIHKEKQSKHASNASFTVKERDTRAWALWAMVRFTFCARTIAATALLTATAAQSKSEANGWCNLRLKLGERVAETILRWWSRLVSILVAQSTPKRNQKETHVYYSICVCVQRMQGKQISLALIHFHTNAHTCADGTLRRLIDKLHCAQYASGF